MVRVNLYNGHIRNRRERIRTLVLECLITACSCLSELLTYLKRNEIFRKSPKDTDGSLRAS